MTDSIKYFAFQDTNAGLIQWVGKGADEVEVATAFKADVRLEESPEEIVDDMEVTELTAEQYERLKDVDGQDQESIDYLESIK